DSIKMLYEDASPNNIKSALLYVVGGNKVPVGVLNSMVNAISGIFGDDSTRVSLSITTGERSKVVLLTSIEGETRFDKYDSFGFSSTFFTSFFSFGFSSTFFTSFFSFGFSSTFSSTFFSFGFSSTFFSTFFSFGFSSTFFSTFFSFGFSSTFFSS